MGKNSDYIGVPREYLSLIILQSPNNFLLIFFPLDWKSVYVLF